MKKTINNMVIWLTTITDWEDYYDKDNVYLVLDKGKNRKIIEFNMEKLTCRTNFNYDLSKDDFLFDIILSMKNEWDNVYNIKIKKQKYEFKS